MDSNKNFNNQTTFDLAFGLASYKFTEVEKFEVLSIIKERQTSEVSFTKNTVKSTVSRPGTKSEMIRKLHESGKSPKEIFDALNKKGTKLNGKQVKVYFPEIYRITGTKK